MKRSPLPLIVLCLAFFAGPGHPSAAVTVTTLHSFDKDDGWQPLGTLLDGGDGYLYGTTQYGGTLLDERGAPCSGSRPAGA